MVQTLFMVIALLVVGAVVQTNIAVIHTQTALTLPGDPSVPISYLRLLAAIGAAAVLVWLGGMLDLALVRGRLRHRDAAMAALEQDLWRFKGTAYEQQQPALNDVRGRLEVVVHELRGMVARIENALRGPSDRVPRETAARSDGTLRTEAAVAVGSPATRPEEPRELEEAAAQPRRRWPL